MGSGKSTGTNPHPAARGKPGAAHPAIACRIVPPDERGATPGDPGLILRKFAARCNGTSETSGLEDKERQASHQVNGFRPEKQDHPRLCRNRHARRTAGSRPRGVDGQRPTPFSAPDASIATDRTASGRSSGCRPDDRIDQRGAPPPCRRPVGVPRPALLNLPRGPNRRTGRLGSCGVGFGAPARTAHRAQGQECGGFPGCPDSTRVEAGGRDPAPWRWAASATARGRRPAHAGDARDRSLHRPPSTWRARKRAAPPSRGVPGDRWRRRGFHGGLDPASRRRSASAMAREADRAMARSGGPVGERVPGTPTRRGRSADRPPAQTEP